MKKQEITVAAQIDGPTFSEYAIFDVMRRQRRYLRPLLFAIFFAALSALAFSRRGTIEQAGLLGGVLLGVGLFLPLVYVVSFLFSVRRQSRALNPKKAAYTLELRESGLTVKKGEQTIQAPWKDLYAAYRLKQSICLYVDAQHSFLLPRSSGEEKFEAAWSMVERCMESGKRRVYSRKDK